MSSQTEYIRDQRRLLMQIRAEVEKRFYYMEGEALTHRPAPDKWNLLEIFEHLNIYHFHYIQQFREALSKAPELNKEEFNHTWFAKLFINSMQPRDGEVRNKMNTFAKSDPRKLQEKNKTVLQAGVVFRDFIDGMDQLIELFDHWEGRDATAIRVKTFLPFIKLRVIDTMGFLVAHAERHLLQARQTVEISDEEATTLRQED